MTEEYHTLIPIKSCRFLTRPPRASIVIPENTIERMITAAVREASTSE